MVYKNTPAYTCKAHTQVSSNYTSLSPMASKSHVIPVQLLAFLFFFNIIHFTRSTQCIRTEREALLKLKSGLQDPGNRLSAWVGDNCCSWVGVRCSNRTGRVVRLDLRDDLFHRNAPTQLSGELTPSLLALQHLKHLDLSGNYFTGTSVPEFIASFKELTYLNLSWGGFEGTVPWQLGNISSLRYLDLSFNDLRDDTDGNVRWLHALGKLPSLLSLGLHYCNLNSLPHAVPYTYFKSLSSLDLSSNIFNTTIPEWLFNITTLKYLYLSYNQFKGSIPSSVWSLASLNVLDLKNNQFKGSIPSSVGRLASLNVLDLSNNQFKGSIPSSVGRLASLNVLDLRFNQFKGSIPSSVGSLASLNVLDLSGNTMTGPLPKELGHLCNLQSLRLSNMSQSIELNQLREVFSGCVKNSLEELDFSESQLTGTLPEWLGEIKNLKSLFLNDNQIYGSIPESLGRLSSLVTLDLSLNSLNGVISKAHLANLTKLKILYLSSNSLVLDVASDWVPPFNLEYLALGSCQIGPEFPRWLQTQYKLSSLDLSNAGISDALPDWFWSSFSQLHFLDLSNNQISGGIPSSLCKLVELESLILSNNHLSGELPDCWDKLSELKLLSFSNNNFSGGIPSSICSHDSLGALHLSKNGLTGELPYNLQNCTRLITLDLGNNKFTGKIPSWVGENLSSLRILNLRSNKLDGDIPHQLSQLSQLRILDLSHNALSGVIPRSFGNFSTMRGNKNSMQDILASGDVVVQTENYSFIDYDPYVFLNWNGKELQFRTISPFFGIVDLSHNNLFGIIPGEFEDLIALVSLNLSENHLTGKIPNRIGNLTHLQSLDLSRNALSGEIPQSLAMLTFLSHLNLSYNSLSGSIPTGPQLQTLTDPFIYVGNLDLCGFPLPKCGEEPMPPISSIGRDKEDEVEDDQMWIYVGIGPGFGVGIWVFSWIILFKKPWRDAYFHWVDNMCTTLHLTN